jgi:hypothetical protein
VFWNPFVKCVLTNGKDSIDNLQDLIKKHEMKRSQAFKVLMGQDTVDRAVIDAPISPKARFFQCYPLRFFHKSVPRIASAYLKLSKM